MAKSSANFDIKKILLNFKKGQLLGVDIGASAIKMALLSPHKKSYKIEKFYHYSLPEASIIEDEIQRPDEMISYLKEGISKIDYKDAIACLGIDGLNTMTKRLSIPDGSKEEIEDNVLWEADQYISFGADESEVDYHIIGKSQTDDGIKDVIVCASKSSVIENYTAVLEEAGLKVKIVDLKFIALSNIFENIYQNELGNFENGAIVIDFGAQFTKIMVYRYGAPLLTKEILLGGMLVTEEIQRQMGVNYFEAEDLKIHGDESGNLPEEILPIIDFHLENLIGEIKKVLNFYIASGSSEQVTHCFITGGSSLLPGLKEKLEATLDMDVDVIEPLNFLEVASSIKNDQRELISKSGLVSLGLGMRKIK